MKRGLFISLFLLIAAILVFLLLDLSGKKRGEQYRAPFIDESHDISAPVSAGPSRRHPLASSSQGVAIPTATEPSHVWSTGNAAFDLVVAEDELLAVRDSKEGVRIDALKDAIARGKEVVNRYKNREFLARRTAGLYTVIQRHEPDVPLQFKHDPKMIESFAAENGEWKLVQLPRGEYPELYRLCEQILEMENEVESMEMLPSSK